MKRTILCGALCIALLGHAQSIQVSVKNPIDLNRRDVAEIPAKQLYERLGVSYGTPVVVKNQDGVEVPSQQTHDGWLLVQSRVHPLETETYTVSVGTPQTYRNDVSGRLYPERKDDLGWENDRNAWRVYGPALRGDNPHGIDCFTKNQQAPSLDGLYQGLFKQKISYHEDHGLGMDAYTVGPTLGCGAPAFMRADTLLYSVVYDEVEILENGPLRFQARLVYHHPEGFDEIRVVQQDRGSHMVRCEVTTSPQPDTPSLRSPIAPLSTGDCSKGEGNLSILSGCVVHKDNPDAYVINKKYGYVAYADNISSPLKRNGQLFVGCLYTQKMKKLRYLPLKKEVADAVGHVIGQKPYQWGETFTYWFGSGWSLYDVPSMHVWETLLQDYRQQIEHPLEVSF